ncbi:UDP-4-amino-4,6-dideoxy-N-acetyl-beta-L-altrosamine transaminase [Paenibacillus melissococcoides]|uniref:UDP-4-amino-4,6-dideoxy-N-acetyl-beta-L-altrosami ne transaminase n=2 Tax=Paenibacillus TaxID=44249 RepID=A0ABN8UE77_9BACL|nr:MULTISPECIES: UDP-4-amino-4,6-dideoxy-N-acetyl-beta-L-altrosamine transaminase [Paenibacillus]MEB9894623.1 UDP-4-amino-4,6-dideoxy-N-acetyl-beta-L-altrosamine transaminase [Bacillus cereus]CAH8248885.1 UDP-4-amino-4,6-dideoxy-N-acetyl-beta-L-altrosamine transaminase [Paenibacillus melissococcoides]CAH8720694.1 UDP-4-amino-4,6-dideoxy-N-acetyl-beta-L-altrosamine transaminase [Paenibacillus melissococcoides]CAH8720947.1 UDP-4-amino-4,6-dideoxy-N-acetyl-beta-L-altrosamine transaminase [Paenibac
MASKVKRADMLSYGKQWIDDEDIQAVIEVLKGDYITQGPFIEQFEREVAEYVGAKYAVAFSNGTAALHGACFAAQIGSGDEVITAPITFLASSNCVLYRGGVPVFADIDMTTYNIDPREIEAKVTPQTKAIIPVDFTGQPAAMDRIMDIADENQLIVIQDAAHSLGASFAGKKVGSMAHMTMVSFHPVKHVTTGEGGIIVTDNELYYKRLKLFRNHGMTRDRDELTKYDGPWYYEMLELGYNYRMTDMQAALGCSQFKKLDGFIKRRREIASAYNKAFASLPGLVIPSQHEQAESSWHLYVLRWLPEYIRVNRKELVEQMHAMNIGVNVHYIPVYLQPYYRRLGYNAGLCPNAELYYDTAMTLPLYPRMDDKDIDDVIEAVKEVYTRYRQ